jgi:hypothetical protein
MDRMMKMTDEGNPLPLESRDIRRRAITALWVAIAVGTCLALVSLFVLDFLFIFAFFLSILIVRTAYRVGVPPHLQRRFIVTRWTHLIALGSSLVGGLSAAVLREGLCFVVTNLKIVRLEPFQHIECGTHMTRATLFGASFFLLLPTMLFAWWFWYLGRAEKG